MLHTAALDNYASTVYLVDTTGENFIENIIHGTNLPSLLKKLSPTSRILELGYGEGTITAPLVELGYAVEIVEGSARLCQAVRDRFGEKVPVHEFMFEEFKPTQLYDAALALHILEHVDNPRTVISNVATWLAPGGGRGSCRAKRTIPASPTGS